MSEAVSPDRLLGFGSASVGLFKSAHLYTLSGIWFTLLLVGSVLPAIAVMSDAIACLITEADTLRIPVLTIDTLVLHQRQWILAVALALHGWCRLTLSFTASPFDMKSHRWCPFAARLIVPLTAIAYRPRSACCTRACPVLCCCTQIQRGIGECVRLVAALVNYSNGARCYRWEVIVSELFRSGQWCCGYLCFQLVRPVLEWAVGGVCCAGGLPLL